MMLVWEGQFNEGNWTGCVRTDKQQEIRILMGFFSPSLSSIYHNHVKSVSSSSSFAEIWICFFLFFVFFYKFMLVAFALRLLRALLHFQYWFANPTDFNWIGYQFLLPRINKKSIYRQNKLAIDIKNIQKKVNLKWCYFCCFFCCCWYCNWWHGFALNYTPFQSKVRRWWYYNLFISIHDDVLHNHHDVLHIHDVLHGVHDAVEHELDNEQLLWSVLESP